MRPVNLPLVTTIKERCRVCYTCVRECPAKAIRIAVGQAEVIPERCIGCGNCVRVCSQHAKQVYDSVDQVARILDSGERIAACLAPSFPAEFFDMEPSKLVGMLRALGFHYVNEVAFGADLVAKEYYRLLSETSGKRFIATTCPAIVEFVERYHPRLVKSLAPIVSPMVATARVLREMHGADLKIIFIGPCIAKKGESVAGMNGGEIDGVLTFVELRQLFRQKQITPQMVQPEDFDLPHAGAGALFPISRGMLQAANISEDLIQGEVVAAEGRMEFVEAIKEFETGHLDARLLEILCCEGCIMGSGMSCDAPLFSRRSRISQHVRKRKEMVDLSELQKSFERFAQMNLRTSFTPNDQRIPMPSYDELSEIMARMGKYSLEDELNCGACGYDTCREHAVAIFKGLAESEMCLPYIIEQLRKTVRDLAVSNDQLASTQEALMQSEKLASMGQLAAGIAHEVNNPLGVVLMYAHMLLEECDQKSQIRDDLTMIVEQADRCKKIVSGLLHFARQNKVLLNSTDLRELVERSLRSVPIPDGITVQIEHQLENPRADLDKDQMTQVLVNLISNAVAAMPAGGVLTIRTSGDDTQVQISVSDTGIGIPKENLSKIFEPFFTTKQMGKGTGLGLAVTYGIIKMHRGDIRVESNANPDAGSTGTTFTIALPRHTERE